MCKGVYPCRTKKVKYNERKSCFEKLHARGGLKYLLYSDTSDEDKHANTLLTDTERAEVVWNTQEKKGLVPTPLSFPGPKAASENSVEKKIQISKGYGNTR